MLLKYSENLLNKLLSCRPKSNRNYTKLIDILPKVQNAIKNGEPVVALESTIITHGMPHPQNVNTALEVEDKILKSGAIPATIAIIDGRIKVGLSEIELRNLALKPLEHLLKCSRRDLPFVLSQKLSGGTTVAATMIIANMVGIPVFATGGIGGVHREGHISLDVSADLIELGRTPVAVVCSGIKSILDVPRTLEYLETQGVCVATYGCENKHFPDFYTRDSGCKVPYNLQKPADAAKLINLVHDLDLKSGILIGVPIPKEHSLNEEAIRSAINEACLNARKQNITGKEVTPFLLETISKITKGSSLGANIALIKNNALVASYIAQELSLLKNSSSVLPAIHKNIEAPLVIGASILDLSLTMVDDFPMKFNGATYYTSAKQSAGGVGRNLAEGIFKLHGKVNFLSAVGNDEMGKSLLQLMPSTLRDNIKVDEKNATSMCSVIFDKFGDCKLILGDMDIHKSISTALVKRNENLFSKTAIVVFDANLPLSTIESVLELSSRYNRPVFFEPTDMRFAGKPFELSKTLTKQIKFISPNIYELKTIVEVLTENDVDWEPDISVSTSSLVAKVESLIMLILKHFECILVTMGHHGVLVGLRCRDGTNFAHKQPLYNAETGEYISVDISTNNGKNLYDIRYYPAPSVKDINNVSGAGDSFSSGFITGLIRGNSVEKCVKLGFNAALCSLKSDSAIPSNYSINIETEVGQIMKDPIQI